MEIDPEVRLHPRSPLRAYGLVHQPGANQEYSQQKAPCVIPHTEVLRQWAVVSTIL